MRTVSQPTSVISAAEETLRVTLAACTEWQQWLGVDSAADALKRIYSTDVPPPVNHTDSHQAAERMALRPFAVVHTATKNGFTVKRVADGYIDEHGRLVIGFEMDVPTKDRNNSGELVRQMQNRLGRILRRRRDDPPGFVGLMDLAYQPGYLTIDEIAVDGPYEPDEAEAEGEGYHLFAFFHIKWGGYA